MIQPSSHMSVQKFRAMASKAKKIMGVPNTEHHFQVEAIRWFRFKYPKYLIYAIPNGGFRAKTTAEEMRAEGETAGMPDTHIPVPKKGFASLYIELKNGKKGILSKKQKEMIERLRMYGNKVEVAWNLDEFRQIVDDYLL